MSINDIYVKVATAGELAEVLATLPPEAEVFVPCGADFVPLHAIALDWLNEDVYLESKEHTVGVEPHEFHDWKENN